MWEYFNDDPRHRSGSRLSKDNWRTRRPQDSFRFSVQHTLSLNALQFMGCSARAGGSLPLVHEDAHVSSSECQKRRDGQLQYYEDKRTPFSTLTDSSAACILS